MYCYSILGAIYALGRYEVKYTKFEIAALLALLLTHISSIHSSSRSLILQHKPV